MQGIIEELIRWLGYSALWLLTLGRYRGGMANDRLPEGAVGLVVVIGVAILVYSFSF